MQLRSKYIAYHVLVICFGLIMIYPIVWMFISSLKSESAIFTHPLALIPSSFHWGNYIKGLEGTPQLHFSRFFLNSIFVSVTAMIGAVLSSSFVGYGFARIDFKFKKLLFGVLIGTLLLPQEVLLIPRYVIFNEIGWVNTFFPIIVPPFLGGISIFVFLMVQFIRSIPYELDEAAIIDGCSKFGVYWRIILPLCKPGLTTIAIFAFMWTWDDFFTPLVYLNNPKLYTVPVGLSMFSDPNTGTAWGQLFAMSTLSLLPILIIFFFGQKYLMEGIATSGLKG